MGLGLVLSGGGTRCVAQLAVAKCLQEWGLQPAVYAGSSAGSLVAALLASGRDPEEILNTVKSLNLLSMLSLRPNKKGLMDIGGVLNSLTRTLPLHFEELNAPVTIAATNLRTGCCDFFSRGALLPPLLASCCMPVFFSPVSIGSDLYIDAGITNNLPADALWGRCTYLLGVHTNPVDPEFEGATVKNILERTFLLTINGNVKGQKKLCHRLLEPDFLKTVKVFDFRRVEEVYEYTLLWLRPQMPQLAEEIRQITA